MTMAKARLIDARALWWQAYHVTTDEGEERFVVDWSDIAEARTIAEGELAGDGLWLLREDGVECPECCGSFRDASRYCPACGTKMANWR